MSLRNLTNTADLPGTRIPRLAETLVANAPARVEVNGVTLRARYATTRPRDVVAQYWRSMAIRYPRATS